MDHDTFINPVGDRTGRLYFPGRGLESTGSINMQVI